VDQNIKLVTRPIIYKGNSTR